MQIYLCRVCNNDSKIFLPQSGQLSLTLRTMRMVYSNYSLSALVVYWPRRFSLHNISVRYRLHSCSFILQKQLLVITVYSKRGCYKIQIWSCFSLFLVFLTTKLNQSLTNKNLASWWMQNMLIQHDLVADHKMNMQYFKQFSWYRLPFF